MKATICAAAIVLAVSPFATAGDQPAFLLSPRRPYLKDRGSLSAWNAYWHTPGDARTQPHVQATRIDLRLDVKYSQTYLVDVMMRRTQEVNVESLRSDRQPGTVRIPIPGDRVRFWFKTPIDPNTFRALSVGSSSRPIRRRPVSVGSFDHRLARSAPPRRTQVTFRVTGPKRTSITVYWIKVVEWKGSQPPREAHLPLAGKPFPKLAPRTLPGRL